MSDTNGVRSQTENPSALNHAERAATVAQSSRRPVVKYVVRRDPVLAHFRKMAEVLIPTDRFYNLAGRLTYIEPGRGLTLLSPATFAARALESFELAIHDDDEKEDSRKRFDLLARRRSEAMLDSESIVSLFPPLDRYSRLPLFTADWRLSNSPGYDAATRIYYDGVHVVPASRTTVLDKTLEEFCWKDNADRVNFMGILLTAVTMPSWVGRHPFVVVNGNRPGVGKTALARMVGILSDAAIPRTIGYTASDDEFEKQIATVVATGSSVIVVDNAKRGRQVREVTSPALERSITDHTLHFRRLGSNASISRPNDVIFALTMNHAKLSADLARRSVPINREYEGPVRNRQFAIPDLAAFVLKHRDEIAAELVGMVQRWLDAGRPPATAPARHSICQEWAATIDAILRLNGLEGFLSNGGECEDAFSLDFDLLSHICHAHHAEPPATAAQWASKLADGPLAEQLKDNGVAKSPRAQATIVGQLFSQYVGTSYDVGAGRFILKCVGDGVGHHSRQYHFVPSPVNERDGSNHHHESAADVPHTPQVASTAAVSVTNGVDRKKPFSKKPKK